MIVQAYYQIVIRFKRCVSKTINKHLHVINSVQIRYYIKHHGVYLGHKLNCTVSNIKFFYKFKLDYNQFALRKLKLDFLCTTFW